MNDSKNSRFKSYIEDSDLENVPLNEVQRTKLLCGEVLICEAPNVTQHESMNRNGKGTFGVLTVTNFKLAFASASEEQESTSNQRNSLLAPNEISLSSIDIIYQIGERSRKKMLIPGHNISMKVKELQIVCKNMRVLNFKFYEKDSGKNITNALLHHSTPKNHNLLFAFDYKEPYYRPIFKDVKMFRTVDDWRKELERTRCKNWRVSCANENFHMSQYMPRNIIVPDSTTDTMLQEASRYFRYSICPAWVWGTSNGAALVRMADLLGTVTDRTQENIMLEHIRKSHYNKRMPCIVYLTKDAPTHKDIQLSYMKLRDLCVADSIRIFKTQDSKFYSLLEGSKWLHHVSFCLTKALEASSELYDGVTVVLQEGDGHDMNCVISSLIQLMLDPHWRTKRGFQSLIQKEWVVLGHPFVTRLHLIQDDTGEPAPYFLLFLDCVWQLLQQYPTAFQISETYLTTLWDSTHITIFDTFIFNCERDRVKAREDYTSVCFRSVWDWSEQFTDKDIWFFCNPLFDDSFKERLLPHTTVPFMEIWSQCYFRWIPCLDIRHGGKVQIELSCKILAADIHMSNQRLGQGDINGRVSRTKEEMVQLLREVNSFFPFSHNNSQLQSILSDNNDLLSVDGLDTQSILNLNIE